MMTRIGLAGALLTASAAAQTAVEVGETYEGTLGGATSYTIELADDTFVIGHVDQISVDVVVTVYDGEGEIVGRFDGPGEGLERFQFDGDDPGTYRIEVAPFEEATGDYTFMLAVAEPIATDGPGRVDQIMTPFDNSDTPGGVIGVVRGGDLVFAKAYGSANLTHDIPFQVGTRTNIGSTSKQFTAFAICLLASEGKLSLDDDIRTYVPTLPDLGQRVTLRHLLTHTSGYREFLNLLAMSGRQLGLGDHITREELIGIVKRQPALQNDPGAEWNYNNTGYGLMTVVVENVTGQAFDEWMDEHVFTPLGMNDTFVRTSRTQIIENCSMGYLPNDGGYVDGLDLGGAMGAGAIYTTPGDLAIWLANYASGTLGGTEIFEEMSTAFVLNDGEETGYGLGLFVGEIGGQTMVFHGGADTAHRSMLHYYPEIDAGVIALSNNASFAAAPIANQVAEAFFRDEIDMEPPEQATDEVETDFNASSYDTAAFDALTGRYELEAMAGFILTFTREDDKIFIQATGQPKLELTPTSETTFKLTVVDASIEFHVDDDGTCSSLTLHQNGSHAANRLEDEPWAPTQDQLDAYSGRYFSAELETYYEIVLDEDSLIVEHRRFKSTLTARDEHEFGGTFPIGSLTFDVANDGTVRGFTIENGRTRDIRFEPID